MSQNYCAIENFPTIDFRHAAVSSALLSRKREVLPLLLTAKHFMFADCWEREREKVVWKLRRARWSEIDWCSCSRGGVLLYAFSRTCVDSRLSLSTRVIAHNNYCCRDIVRRTEETKEGGVGDHRERRPEYWSWATRPWPLSKQRRKNLSMLWRLQSIVAFRNPYDIFDTLIRTSCRRFNKLKIIRLQMRKYNLKLVLFIVSKWRYFRWKLNE